MIRTKAFLNDYRAGSNAAEAAQLKWWILHRLTVGPVNADQISRNSKCGDIAMYLALHDLVINNLVHGVSPYDTSAIAARHNELEYTLRDNDAAKFFSSAAGVMHELWRWEEWDSLSYSGGTT